MLISREDQHHLGMCQGDLLPTAVQLHGSNAWWCDNDPAVPNRFWSSMLVMTGASELWGVRSSTSPPQGPSSTSELSCCWISSTLNFFSQGLQADHTGWSRCYDQWCPKCSAEDHWKIHRECPVIISLSALPSSKSPTQGSVWLATTSVKSSQPFRADAPGPTNFSWILRLVLNTSGKVCKECNTSEKMALILCPGFALDLWEKSRSCPGLSMSARKKRCKFSILNDSSQETLLRLTLMKKASSRWCVWHRGTWGRSWISFRCKQALLSCFNTNTLSFSHATWPLEKSRRIMSTHVSVSTY